MSSWEEEQEQKQEQETKKKTLLLTGGAGFVGSRFTELYANKYKKIYIVDNFSATPRMLKLPNVHYIDVDITDINSFSSLPKHIDCCIHLAAAISVAESTTNPEKYNRINVEGSRNIFHWCSEHGCKVCVCASSAAVYGKVKETKLTEEDADGGLSPYALTKFQMEHIAKIIFPVCKSAITYKSKQEKDTDIAQYINDENRNNEMRINFIRPFNIYGPRQPCSSHPSFIPAAMVNAMKSGSITVCGDGRQTRDFVFVDDVCHAFHKVCNAPGMMDSCDGNECGHCGAQHLRPYNVGTGRSIAIVNLAKRIADTVQQLRGSKVIVEHVPARPMESMFSEADISSIQQEIGWEPSVSLEEGLSLTAQYFNTL